MTDGSTVKVYLFVTRDDIREIAPRYMWGTLDAIAGLHDCKPVLESAREVDAGILENGFLFGDACGVQIHIDEPAPRS